MLGKRKSGWGKRLGDSGERYAVSFLEERGYRVVEKNYRCRGGEIDLIAWDGEDLVFIEVKTRESVAFGQPFEAVTREKRRRMMRIALGYLKGLRKIPPCRFDVVSIVAAGGIPEAELFRGAFEMEAPF